jgi:hypothetical protein
MDGDRVMQQIIFIALTLCIFALTLTEICYSVKAMRYHQALARKRNILFDAYAVEFEMEVRSRLRQAYYKADMDSKYNE